MDIPPIHLKKPVFIKKMYGRKIIVVIISLSMCPNSHDRFGLHLQNDIQVRMQNIYTNHFK